MIKYSHFTVHEIAPGVDAAIGTRERFSVSNAAIIDLGGEALVAASNLISVGLEFKG